MRLPFFRKATTGDEPLIVAMTGARLGESVLFAGSSAGWALPLAARTGLSGRCLIVGTPQVTRTIEASASKEGVLVETAEEAPADHSFDLAVVEATEGWEDAARQVMHAIRPGGRIMVVAGAPPAGFMARLTGAGGPTASVDAIASRLRQLGWQRVRPVGARDGVGFIEGFAAS